jgi:hypothetical protein
MKKIFAAAMIMATPFGSQAGDWEYSLTPYLWLPTISVDSNNVDGNGNGLDVGPTDYLEALDFGFMMAGEARKDKLVLKGDFIYLDFNVDEKEVKTPIVTADASLTGFVPTLLAGMNVIETDNYYMDILAGWRRADLEFSVDATVTVGPINKGVRVVHLDMSYDDFLLAVNGQYDFAGSNWSVPYYADIGAGDSDLTWQAMIGLDYAFDSWKLHMNYRHLDYDFGDVSGTVLGNSVVAEDIGMVFSGPSIGAKFEF